MRDDTILAAYSDQIERLTSVRDRARQMAENTDIRPLRWVAEAIIIEANKMLRSLRREVHNG